MLVNLLNGLFCGLVLAVQKAKVAFVLFGFLDGLDGEEIGAFPFEGEEEEICGEVEEVFGVFWGLHLRLRG